MTLLVQIVTLRAEMPSDRGKGDTSSTTHMMQGVAVLPCSMGLTKEAPKALMQMLDALGVVPECLALPWQPGRSHSRLCSGESLFALIEVLLDKPGCDLSKSEKVMRSPASGERFMRPTMSFFCW